MPDRCLCPCPPSLPLQSQHLNEVTPGWPTANHSLPCARLTPFLHPTTYHHLRNTCLCLSVLFSLRRYTGTFACFICYSLHQSNSVRYTLSFQHLLGEPQLGKSPHRLVMASLTGPECIRFSCSSEDKIPEWIRRQTKINTRVDTHTQNLTELIFLSYGTEKFFSSVSLRLLLPSYGYSVCVCCVNVSVCSCVHMWMNEYVYVWMWVHACVNMSTSECEPACTCVRVLRGMDQCRPCFPPGSIPSSRCLSKMHNPFSTALALSKHSTNNWKAFLS